MPFVFWFSRLRSGVNAAEYEQWVREVDYRAARNIPSITNYRVYHINGPCLGDAAPYDYVEVVEITDIDAYRQDIEQHPAARVIAEEIGQFVESAGNAWGIPLVD
jgi:hypothetical protein